MRRMVIGVGLLAGVVVLARGAVTAPEPVFANQPVSLPAGQNLIALTHTLEDGHQQLTVVDPKLRAVAVYHIHPANGALTLRSVRNIHWDLQMSQFNGVSPLPQQIRSMLEQN
ncbi:MAG: hypothetical protein GTO03_02720 [Planctomycetales bacterium]|nr:hypothetical protein [Planctomycetales bacterium]